MAYSPSIWPKVLVAVPAFLIAGVLLGNGFNEQIERYENRAATAAAREAMQRCAREHGVEIAWRSDPRLLTFDVEERYFSAANPAEVAAANCIVDTLPEMAHRSQHPIVCFDETAIVQVDRRVTGQHFNPPEENYSFFLSPCGAVQRENP
ncbi:hypothetical protein [Erythrobacter sp. EC-HK427]|uniref:hypothetical protein n=1 Tax=Erythrobacter sp. EC-HK427 TaxID=2038396 RepID=UPI00125137DE|nr:hypothetical protein [Erythrobacter sp. EC-HK427]VVT14302.1 hypothetical protein ERY430_70096 [Erythrobacter sp. EC-HK427]